MNLHFVKFCPQNCFVEPEPACNTRGVVAAEAWVSSKLLAAFGCIQ